MQEDSKKIKKSGKKENRKLNSKNLRFIKKYGLRIWIAIASAALFGMIVYAAYTNQQNKTKKVIATSAEAQMRFSSNYLEEGTTKMKTVVKTADDPTIPVTVRNYSRSNPTIWYSSDIKYTLYVELTDTSGISPSDSGYAERISYLIGEDNITVSINGSTVTLNASSTSGTFNNQVLDYSRDSASQKEYTITYPNVTTKACVRVIATPTPERNYPDLKPISAVLAISDKDNIQSEGWSGDFNDSRSKTPSEYDAYNYCLSGYGKSDTATFAWNASKLEVNKEYFLTVLGADVASATTEQRGEDTWKTVTIHLDSETSGGRYDFQIFKTGKNVSFDSWSDIESCVEFDDGID